MTYLIIFISKLIENTFSTLRIILIANNKKLLGAIFTFLISIIWIISVSFIVFDFKDYLKILIFGSGSAIGSYLGNILEEKLALGCIIVSFKTDNYLYFNSIFKYKPSIVKLKNGYKMEISCKRKDEKKIIKSIKNVNKHIKIDIIKIFNC